ncbi:flagellar hook-length control protein FliK [Desulfothermobacter acidiphilus]|uniref:flagellar hook-length control protein FliK n=1 Tax=Desulfothermobacter acidiphilus TaxID=1938353 RepID=UPI003F8A85F1
MEINGVAPATGNSLIRPASPDQEIADFATVLSSLLLALLAIAPAGEAVSEGDQAENSSSIGGGLRSPGEEAFSLETEPPAPSSPASASPGVSGASAAPLGGLLASSPPAGRLAVGLPVFASPAALFLGKATGSPGEEVFSLETEPPAPSSPASASPGVSGASAAPLEGLLASSPPGEAVTGEPPALLPRSSYLYSALLASAPPATQGASVAGVETAPISGGEVERAVSEPLRQVEQSLRVEERCAPSSPPLLFGDSAKAALEQPCPPEFLPQRLTQEILSRVTSWHREGEVLQLQLKLEPPELGRIVAHLTLTEGKLELHFWAPEAGIKEVILHTLPELQQQLARVGVSLGEVAVLVDAGGGHQLPRDQGQPARTALRVAVPEERTEEGEKGFNYWV